MRLLGGILIGLLVCPFATALIVEAIVQSPLVAPLVLIGVGVAFNELARRLGLRLMRCFAAEAGVPLREGLPILNHERFVAEAAPQTLFLAFLMFLLTFPMFLGLFAAAGGALWLLVVDPVVALITIGLLGHMGSGYGVPGAS